MSTWWQTLVQLSGPSPEVQRFRLAFDGAACCNRSFCVHRLAEMLFEPGEDRDLLSEIRILDEDPFDEVECAYNLYARRSLIPYVGLVSYVSPDLIFSTQSCDLTSGAGHLFYTYEMACQGGRFSMLRVIREEVLPMDGIKLQIHDLDVDSFARALIDPSSVFPEPRHSHAEG